MDGKGRGKYILLQHLKIVSFKLAEISLHARCHAKHEIHLMIAV
jgi:hypothetical protein